ncbi:MAG: DivIVA domain-containing protein [Actinomycetota bacterium]
MARKRKRKERDAEAGFSEAEAAAGDDERQRLTPVDIQGKVFRLAFRGYSERDVDEFLDRITEDLAALHEENKRLAEQLAEGGGNPAGMEEAQRQAEAIVRQAREHAARLVEDAEASAAAGDDVLGSAGLPTSFLLKERQFLQQMAGLIQDHARRLKEDARRARSASPEPAPGERERAEPPAAPAPVEEPSASASGTEGVPSAATSGSTEPPVPEQEQDRPVVLPEAPEEATAPWTQVDPEPPEGQGEGEDQDRDPLLSAWESAFTAEKGAEPPGEKAVLYPSEARNRKDEEAEPSLRELFWGDEG